jgi:nucleoid-associated protein YgaU
MADQLDEMKKKYATVLSTIEQQQVELSHVNMQDGKLFIQGVAPSEEAKNKVWDQIKLVNADWVKEVIVDINVDAKAKSAQAGAQQQTYTVKAGDSLSKISKDLYGNANAYMKIFEANRDLLSDPNKISAGQTLKIPAA